VLDERPTQKGAEERGEAKERVFLRAEEFGI
jgi:hypothetical protein